MEKTMCLGSLGKAQDTTDRQPLRRASLGCPCSDPGFSLPHIRSADTAHLRPARGTQLTRQQRHGRGKVVFSEAHAEGQREESGAEGCRGLSCVLSLCKRFALHFFLF